MPHPETHSKFFGLYALLVYARTHAHSRQWLGAIVNLMHKEERADG